MPALPKALALISNTGKKYLSLREKLKYSVLCRFWTGSQSRGDYEARPTPQKGETEPFFKAEPSREKYLL